jgi:hypothetical protein
MELPLQAVRSNPEPILRASIIDVADEHGRFIERVLDEGAAGVTKQPVTGPLSPDQFYHLKIMIAGQNAEELEVAKQEADQLVRQHKPSAT